MRVVQSIVLALLLSVVGCTRNSRPIVGTWRELDGSMTMTFSASGHAIISGQGEGSYEIVDGKTLVVRGGGLRKELPFVLDGDTLEIREPDRPVRRYHRM